MSDVMLFGVLRMPYEMAMGSELSRFQFWQRAQEAADRLEAAECTPAEPAPASTGPDGIQYRAGADDVWHNAPSSELESLVRDGFQLRVGPVAARELDVEAEFRKWKGYELPALNNHGQFHQDWLHREFVAFKAGIERAARSAAQSTAPAPDERPKLDAARKWIASAPHGENCFLHDEGEYDRCFCGKDALEAYLESDSEAAPVSTEQAGDAWISVEDRLPDESLLRFLVTGRAVSGGPLGVHMATLYDSDMYFEGAAESGGCNPCINDVVTHWMPLPAAPSPNNSPAGGKGEQ